MEWKEVRLGEVCDLIAGFAFKAKDFGQFSVKVVKIGDIKPPFVDYVGQVGVDISRYDIDKLSKYTVRYGDYVLAMTGATIGKVGKCISEHPSYINQRVLKFSPKQDVDADYINYTICSNVFAKYVVNHIDSESAQPNISATTISKYIFRIPKEESDQRRIAALLSSLDRKIELNNKINARLEEMAQAIFKNWFVDFEPFKDGKFKESELGMIPEGWKVGCLGEFCKCLLGGTPSRSKKEYWNGEVNWINSGEINKFRILEASEKITELGLAKSATKLLPKKTTVLAITGATLGQVSLLEIDTCANQSVIGVLENAEVPYEYIYPFIKDRIEMLIQHQTGGAQQHINKDNVESLIFLFPANNVLEDYILLVRPMYKRIESLCFENLYLASLRDALLPRLMSGEIEIPE